MRPKTIAYEIITLLSGFTVDLAVHRLLRTKAPVICSGVFKTFKGAIVFDEQNPAASKFDVSIDAASINTGNGLQNKHAKSDEWFDVAKYPQIRYISQKFVKAGAGYQVTGDLEVHGVKKAVTIPFTFQKTAKGAVFAGSFTVNRNDFKLGKPGGDVGEQIKIDISVPVTKQ